MRRIAIVFAAAGVALVAAAAPAWAHVKVEPESAVKGSDAVLAFVVPNEKTTATTNKVVVQFPTDHPIADALTEPIPGWTSEVATAPVKTPIKTDAGTVNDAVKSVTWTASGPGIGAGQFQEFRVSVGLPADADSLTFPTTQTYTDGETVNWVQVTPPGGPEPDSPAPVLTLTNGAPTAGTTPTTTAPTGGTAAASNVKKSDVDNAKTIAIIGVVVGALGLLAGIGGLTMGRRKSA
ncbi:MAG: hypothetical protein QOF59_137 [Actinomycetota bacterium]|nr:hypothetical protein [Actinomycetota bacterium]MDQ1478493.1 hypothetical protein [Actinomycetota bacterium]